MYLSHLLINVGDNPDRPRPGRLWLRNRHRVHQRLCMAFPSRERTERDPHFLQPYTPDDFAGTHVQVARSEDAGFLFRVDPRPGAKPVIAVQSACHPDWDYAFHNARYLLAAEPCVDLYEPRFKANQRLRFRLQANPTRRASRNSRQSSGKPLDPRWIGKRIPVPAEGLRRWLDRHAERAGCQLAGLAETVPGYVYVSRNGERGQRQRLFSVIYDGILEVTDEAKSRAALERGIGPAKAYGFGLLSVAPA